MDKSEEFLKSIDTLFQNKIPARVMNKAKYALLDYIAVTFAGTTVLQTKIKKYLESDELESGNITAIGMNRNIGLKDAVFLNGLHSHALDFDDGTNSGIIHLGSPIFSVLLPLAQKYKINSKRFFESVIIGYEVSFTMAVSIQPKHKEMGYHATGTCGILGIALAASYMLNLSEEEMKNAFSIACVSSTGMLKVLDDDSELKPYNVAKTALLGLISIQMARAGFKGHSDPLGGFRGFLKMMTGEKDTDLKSPLLDGTYAIEKAYTKPYAACRYCHPAIEASINLSAKYEMAPENIKSVHVKTYYWAVNKHDHINIPSISSAKMSIPYGVAVGFIYGKAGLREYELDIVSNKRVLELTKKISVVSDEEITAQFPKVTTAIVTVITQDDKTLIEQVDFPKGEPENPMSQNEFKQRFEELLIYGGKSLDQANIIWNFVENMNDNMNELFNLIQ